MSLAFVTGISLYFAYLIVRSSDNRSARITSNLEKRNIGMDPDRSLTLTIDNFDIAIGVLYGGSNTLVNATNIDEYLSYNLNLIDYALITDPAEIASYGSTYKWEKTRVPLELCDATRFMGMDEITSNLGITDTYYCP